MKPRILLVEDEPVLRSGIRLNLEEEGYEVDAFESADRFLAERKSILSVSSPYDLAVLDVMLPGKIQGLELCRMIRTRWSMPVVFLTARNKLEHKLDAFESGADDYITKPFELEELLARIRARLRNHSSGRTHRIGSYRIDFQRDVAIHMETGEELRFTEKEIGILKLLLENRGRPVTRDEILDRIWGTADFPTNRTIDNFIVKFRRIFEKDPSCPVLFITRHGRGYELAPEGEAEK
jgi:DNA-binding response OmpR family regulator